MTTLRIPIGCSTADSTDHLNSQDKKPGKNEPKSLGLRFDNTYAKLPDAFFTKQTPKNKITTPKIVHINPQGGQLINLDIDKFDNQLLASYFSGKTDLPGSSPLAMAYSGHQFGVWAGQLGDGRALLLGQVRNNSHQLWDIQLKGSGLTPYSRMGDGNAVLRSCIREYLCAEAMHALGIPTTRSLCIVATNQTVYREKAEPGAILTRLATSHIRFGHFEHFYYTNQWDHLTTLVNYVIEEHHPQLIGNPERWFAEVVFQTAQVIAKWMATGFCHGVMNTDNMSILGLTIDYGPFGFIEAFNPSYICNHSDVSGQYAYNRQPAVALWNLKALAHALQPLIPKEKSDDILEHYAQEFTSLYHQLMRKKIGGMDTKEQQVDELWQKLLSILNRQKADYTLAFRYLAQALENDKHWLDLFSDQVEAYQWLEQFKRHHVNQPRSQLQQKLLSHNPKFILRNWVSEIAIRSAEDQQDYQPLNNILALVQSPYEEHTQFSKYALPAPPHLQNLHVSCSS